MFLPRAALFLGTNGKGHLQYKGKYQGNRTFGMFTSFPDFFPRRCVAEMMGHNEPLTILEQKDRFLT